MRKLNKEAVDLQVESSDVEDGTLYVLVSQPVVPDEKPGDPVARWVVEADPKTRKVRHVEFCVATDKGLVHPPYEPTPSQLALFRREPPANSHPQPRRKMVYCAQSKQRSLSIGT